MKNKRILSFILACFLIVCTSGEVFAKEVDKTDVDDLYHQTLILFDQVHEIFPEVEIGDVPSYERFLQLSMSSCDEFPVVDRIFEKHIGEDTYTLYLFEQGGFILSGVNLTAAGSNNGVSSVDSNGRFTSFYSSYYEGKTMRVTLTFTRERVTTTGSYYLSNLTYSNISTYLIATYSYSRSANQRTVTYKGDTLRLDTTIGEYFHLYGFDLVTTVNATTGVVSNSVSVKTYCYFS